jgi:hypothetical protein
LTGTRDSLVQAPTEDRKWVARGRARSVEQCESIEEAVRRKTQNKRRGRQDTYS